MNTASTASTRPRLSGGVTSGTSVERMNTLTASAPDSTSSATNAIDEARGEAEHDGADAEERDREQQRAADPPAHRASTRAGS